MFGFIILPDIDTVLGFVVLRGIDLLPPRPSLIYGGRIVFCARLLFLSGFACIFLFDFVGFFNPSRQHKHGVWLSHTT